MSTGRWKLHLLRNVQAYGRDIFLGGRMSMITKLATNTQGALSGFNDITESHSIATSTTIVNVHIVLQQTKLFYIQVISTIPELVLWDGYTFPALTNLNVSFE